MLTSREASPELALLSDAVRTFELGGLGMDEAQMFGPSVGRGVVLEAVAALRRRSLVERAETPAAAPFTVQSVVMEYVIDHLVEDVADEIARGQPALLVELPLIKAQAKDYVRQTQERLIGASILQRLHSQRGEARTDQRLLALLGGWRGRAAVEQGYGPGNVVNLLRLLRGDLRALDLSHLAIRQAYLAEADAQDASLVGAQLSDTVLAESFSTPHCIALSGDGAYLAAGTFMGGSTSGVFTIGCSWQPCGDMPGRRCPWR